MYQGAIDEKTLRDAVRRRLELRAAAEHGLVIEEMDVGERRIDLALLTPERLEGYELKSDRDSFARLGVQIDAFSRYFDPMTIVTGPRWVGDAITYTPRVWGVTAIGEVGGTLVVRRFRRPQPNPRAKINFLLELLWRYELDALTRELRLGVAARSLKRNQLTAALQLRVAEPQLRARVFHVLLQRYSAKSRDVELRGRRADGATVAAAAE